MVKCFVLGSGENQKLQAQREKGEWVERGMAKSQRKKIGIDRDVTKALQADGGYD